MCIAWSHRRTSSSSKKNSARRTSLSSTSANRSARSSRRRSPRDGSLLGDGRARDPIACARAAGQDQARFKEIPDRDDERQVANDRPSAPAALTQRRQKPQAQHLLTERPAAVAVTNEEADEQQSKRRNPNDGNRLHRPTHPGERVADQRSGQDQQNGQRQGVHEERRHAQQDGLRKGHWTKLSLTIIVKTTCRGLMRSRF